MTLVGHITPIVKLNYASILVKGTIKTVPKMAGAAAAAAGNNSNKR